MLEQLAKEDFNRALRKGFWRKINAWLRGQNNELLPYDEVRQRFPLKGQRYIGLRTVPIENIVGSVGRYRDFDRAFTPKHARTAQRWISIDQARYEDVRLPPVELYKIGEVYFVKDGNHRVSVAREKNQHFIDAYVIEVDIPVTLKPDLDISELNLKQEYANFLEATKILDLRPDANLELTLPGETERLLEHIRAHRWFLSQQQGTEIPFETAVTSWYDNVYLPLVATIQAQGLDQAFPDRTLADLYLWVSEYSWFLREAYKEDRALQAAAESFAKTYADWPARKVASTLRQSGWIDNLILQQEKAHFSETTRLDQTRPNAQIELTLPGKYEKLLEHISVHRWYLGEKSGREIPFHEAAASWYDNVYEPLVKIIRAHNVMAHFPNRTEADLYLWILDHRSRLEEELGWDIATETAVYDLIETHGAEPEESPDPHPAARAQVAPPQGAATPPYRKPRRPGMFTDLLVPLGEAQEDWRALEQALVLARYTGANIHGLHVVPTTADAESEAARALAREFNERCQAAGRPGRLAIEAGSIARSISSRARWVDLIVMPLNHPPAPQTFARLFSGFRTILRRSGRPILAVPGQVSPLDRILLAYNGSPKADEALYLITCTLIKWDAELTILTVDVSEKIVARARAYLEERNCRATFLTDSGPVEQAILNTVQAHNINLLTMGGYGGNPVVEVMLGSTVEKVLQEIACPVLISN